MPDDIVTRLRQPGRNGGVCYCHEIVHRPCADCKERNEAADEIERLRDKVQHVRVALLLAVEELITHRQYEAQTNEMLFNQFLQEARRG